MAYNGASGASRRRITKYKVDFPTLPSIFGDLPQPAEISLIQNERAHDVVVLTWFAPHKQAMANLKTGVPVVFEWSKGGVKNSWHGYVSFVSAEMSAANKKMTEVHCVGASFPAKKRDLRVFKNKTIPQVAAILAQEIGLKFRGESNPRIFKQLTISGQSYWEWLSEQARRIGYVMYVEGLDLVFKPIDKVIDHSSTEAPLLQFFAPMVPTDGLYEDRTLDYFKVLHGEYVEGMELRTTKSVAGVNPDTGKEFFASKTPVKTGKAVRRVVNDTIFTEQRTEQVVHDATSARIAAEGAAHLARFTTPAAVRCQGDPRIRPYKPVYIKGVNKEVDGYWVPLSVKHYMNITGEYSIEMKVATDGVGPNAGSSTRNASAERLGTVNIQAALDNGGKNPSVVKKSDIRLKLKSTLIKEANQGYNRTPMTWVKKKGR
jgi:phage protein D